MQHGSLFCVLWLDPTSLSHNTLCHENCHAAVCHTVMICLLSKILINNQQICLKTGSKTTTFSLITRSDSSVTVVCRIQQMQTIFILNTQIKLDLLLRLHIGGVSIIGHSKKASYDRLPQFFLVSLKIRDFFKCQFVWSSHHRSSLRFSILEYRISWPNIARA